MLRWTLLLVASLVGTASLPAQGVEALAGKRVIFLGDSITQAGGYISFLSYSLEKQNPTLSFDFLGLGLASETLSGLSEDGHAGGKFPRPCLKERLGRVLEKAKPEVVFACYGINDGIYLPLEKTRQTAFQQGMTSFIDQCQKAGVKQIYLITPPIYDFVPKSGAFDYNSVLEVYAKWEVELKVPGVKVIDLHSAMRKARSDRTTPFSPDKVHPGEDGQLFIAKTVLASFGVKNSEEKVATIKADPLFKLVDQKRSMRSVAWMKHIGYTREAKVEPQPLGVIEGEVGKLQVKIDQLRRAK